MQLVIEREKWLRGEGPEGSRLLRPIDGKMCCLGFLCLAKGKTPDEIRDKYSPGKAGFTHEELPDLIKELSTYGDKLHTELCFDMMRVNDSIMFGRYVDAPQGYITESERESELTKLFAKMGVELEFV